MGCRTPPSPGCTSAFLSGDRVRSTDGVQPSGKLRVIDDAADGGQSELSHDSSKLDLCTSIVRDFTSSYSGEPSAERLLAEGICSGGEDLPNAYRHMPMIPAQSDLAAVAYTTTIMSKNRDFAVTIGSLGSSRQFAVAWDSVLQACILMT